MRLLVVCMSRPGRLVAVCALALLLTPPALSGFDAPLGPVLAAAAECEGDECQPPPAAPEDLVPGSAVAEGPRNPPVRFPQSRGGGNNHDNKKNGKRRGKSRGGRR